MAISVYVPTVAPLTAYPRVYRAGLGWRISLLTVGGLGISAALVAGRLLISFRLVGGGSSPQDLWISLLTLAPLGLYAIARALRFRIVLSADRIEIIGAFFMRRMLREDISGWRISRNLYGSTLELMPRDRREDKLWIDLVFKIDPVWREWCATLAYVGAEEEAERKLIQRLYLYLPIDDSVWRIARLRRMAAWVNIGSILLIGTALSVIPWRLSVLLCALLPWVAVQLVARFQPLFYFGGTRDDLNTCLILPLLLPGLWLTLMVSDTHPLHTLDWKGPLLLIGLLVLALILAVVRVDQWARTGMGFFLLSVALGFYGYGAGLGLNALGDISTAQVYPVTVLAKHVRGGGSRRIAWHLVLSSWGPVTNGDDVAVPREVYRSVNPGDTVCVYFKHGALRIPWYTIGRCS